MIPVFGTHRSLENLQCVCWHLQCLKRGKLLLESKRQSGKPDNSDQFFLFKAKFNFPGFHCSAARSKYTFCLSCNNIEILCFISLIPSAANQTSVCCIFPCVVVAGASPYFWALQTAALCAVAWDLASFLVICPKLFIKGLLIRAHWQNPVFMRKRIVW